MMKSWITFRTRFRSQASILLAIALTISLIRPSVFAGPPPRKQVQAQLLDHAEFLCDNCFFGASKYYYCFAAGDQILTGYQKTPTLNWRDDTKNYLTAVHNSWAAWTAPGQTITLSYDDKNIWIARPEGKPAPDSFWAHVLAGANWVSRGNAKQVKLTRDKIVDIFPRDARCGAAAH